MAVSRGGNRQSLTNGRSASFRFLGQAFVSGLRLSVSGALCFGAYSARLATIFWLDLACLAGAGRRRFWLGALALVHGFRVPLAVLRYAVATGSASHHFLESGVWGERGGLTRFGVIRSLAQLIVQAIRAWQGSPPQLNALRCIVSASRLLLRSWRSLQVNRPSGPPSPRFVTDRPTTLLTMVARLTIQEIGSTQSLVYYFLFLSCAWTSALTPSMPIKHTCFEIAAAAEKVGWLW